MYDRLDSQTISRLSAAYNDFRDYHEYEASMVALFNEQLKPSARTELARLRATMPDASPEQILEVFKRWWKRELCVFKAGLLREYERDECTWLYARLREAKAQTRALRLQLHVAQNSMEQIQTNAIARERALARSQSRSVKDDQL